MKRQAGIRLYLPSVILYIVDQRLRMFHPHAHGEAFAFEFTPWR